MSDCNYKDSNYSYKDYEREYIPKTSDEIEDKLGMFILYIFGFVCLIKLHDYIF